MGASWRPLGRLLGLSWGALEAVLGAFEALLGPSWRRSIKEGGALISAAPLECLESPLGPFLKPKSFQNLKKINVLCFFAFSLLEPSWAILGASWGLLGVSWEPLGGLLGASWGLLGPSWGALGALLGPSCAGSSIITTTSLA